MEDKVHFERLVLWVRPIFWFLFWALGPIKTKGRYRVPRSGGLLILSNHQADVDPPALQVACPRVIRFMGKQELFEMPFLRWILPFFGVFSVQRGQADRAALKKAMALIQSGQAVGVFPEGQISPTGEMQPLKPGVALIARQTQCPVICVGLRGTNKILPYGQLAPRPSFRWTHVQWGEVRSFTKEDSTETIMAWVESELRSLSS